MTGAREDIPEELRAFVARVKEEASAPVCVGFGISKPEHVIKIGAFSDGVVVGSALVEVIARYGGRPDLAKEVQSFASQLKAATLPQAGS